MPCRKRYCRCFGAFRFRQGVSADRFSACRAPGRRRRRPRRKRSVSSVCGNLQDEWETHVVRVADLRLPFFASTIGNATGEPAIVLPGGPCRGPEYLGDFAGLGNDRSLVVLHPRGTPRSGGLSRGWWADAADVITLADALGLESIDLVAHSAGTRLALATATQFPDRVRSMALITPPATWLT
ncbi:alpha/beta hydrolase, partial [Microbacterium sp. BF1]|uniref:alpha/beta fold hydrolase n=1 Tax=Microbacterium sp. BF1 TaxID=2821146 RepID=UPI0027E3083B